MKKAIIWGGWLAVTLAMAFTFSHKLFGEGDKATFLIGEATHGHHQIEMACSTCHTSAFGGEDMLQNACTQCHAQELEEAHDSHPKSKFTNPRNADRVKMLDARYCVTCHTEHQLEQTRAMGVTLPDDYCFHCHQDIADDRPSHKDLEFVSCASAGCHNYHDNRALYEDFLVKHAHDPWLLQSSMAAAVSSSFARATSVLEHATPLTAGTSAYAAHIQQHPDIGATWAASSHAGAGVDCGSCHTDQASGEWLDKPGHPQCQSCHGFETEGFLAGKHGMRAHRELATSLAPITPAQARLPFKDEAMHTPHGCNSCHSAHEFNRAEAAVTACLSCHNDDHSLAYIDSPHGKLWQAANAQPAGATPSPSVTCASCHMPRTITTINGERVHAVQHNQNHNLRPNEKMIRSVCMDCHGAAFAIDALADKQLINNNFTGQPQTHIPSIDWALKRLDTQPQ